jgi:hypothetical protein
MHRSHMHTLGLLGFWWGSGLVVAMPLATTAGASETHLECTLACGLALHKVVDRVVCLWVTGVDAGGSWDGLGPDLVSRRQAQVASNLHS